MIEGPAPGGRLEVCRLEPVDQGAAQSLIGGHDLDGSNVHPRSVGFMHGTQERPVGAESGVYWPLCGKRR